MTDQALARLQERAGQNDPEALYRLAMLHIDGDGVPEDNDLAAALLFRAARQDHAAALRRFRLSAAQDDPLRPPGPRSPVHRGGKCRRPPH
ncbi:MAG: SEL1-like repeat protein [Eubacteriales bacterium]|nr:SEL1-like repeat protein [Eubacteriales bacterium]